MPHGLNNSLVDSKCTRPARMAQWSKHSGATCSRVWCAQWLKPQPGRVRLPKNYF